MCVHLTHIFAQGKFLSSPNSLAGGCTDGIQINTLAHCVCALAMYLFWWSKPLDIGHPTSIRGDNQNEILAYLWMKSPNAPHFFSRTDILRLIDYYRSPEIRYLSCMIVLILATDEALLLQSWRQVQVCGKQGFVSVHVSRRAAYGILRRLSQTATTQLYPQYHLKSKRDGVLQQI